MTTGICFFVFKSKKEKVLEPMDRGQNGFYCEADNNGRQILLRSMVSGLNAWTSLKSSIWEP